MMNSVMFLSRVKYDCHVVSSEHDLWDRIVMLVVSLLLLVFPAESIPAYLQFSFRDLCRKSRE